ncbi:MAG: YCF48-related protein [Patescibacteria group bacterium]|nr:YCF48-related protein [Patescibacteria group bacterium]
MFKIKLATIAILLAVSATLSGCVINFGGDAPDNSLTGGVFKTDDFAQTWIQKVAVPTVSGQPQTIAPLDAIDIVLDPSDNQAVYFGSLKNGLYYSYDGANTWQFSKATTERPVASIAVDPKEKCRIYYASNSKLFRTEDCARTWKVMYSDNKVSDYLIYKVIIDHYNPANIYISDSRGYIIKSEDYGTNWRRLTALNSPVTKLVMSQADSRVLMAGTKTKGLFRTFDGGETWQSLAASLKPFKNTQRIRNIATSNVQPGLWIVSTDYGLLRTVNNGDDWIALQLITEERQAKIYALAVSQQDVKKIYYATETTFYTSFDGGETWKSSRLPSPRRGWVIVPDSKKDGVLYLGVMTEPQD